MSFFLHLIVYFILYSVLGWMIDTAHRSILAGRYAPGEGYPFPRDLPFSPVYGFGMLVILALAPAIVRIDIGWQFIALMIALTIFEYVSAIISEWLSSKKLWDYSDQPLNFQGRISLYHSIGWGLIGVLFLHVIHPFVERALYF